MRFLKSTLLLGLLMASNVYADGFSASVGTDYSTGTYGTSSRTNVTYVPFGVKYVTGAYTFRVTVPWISVTGDGTVVPSGLSGSSGSSGATTSTVCTGDRQGGKNGGGGKGGTEDNTCQVITSGGGASTTTTTAATRSTQSGLGDVVAAATYNAYDGGDQGFVVDLTGRIKFGTASVSKNLGSGENDYAVQVNVDKYFGAPYLSAGLGYKWLGEPSGVNYKNIVYGNIGGGYKVTQDIDVGVSYDWATVAISGNPKPQEVSAYASYRINNAYKLSGVLYTGLSNANSDFGGGLTLDYYF